MDIYSKTQKASCVKENINNSHKDFHFGPQYPLSAFPINHFGKSFEENIHIIQGVDAFFVDKANGQKGSKSGRIYAENQGECRPGEDLPAITKNGEIQ